MTSDESALLAAVCAVPDDDIPRLMLADWLEGHGGTVECPTCGGERGAMGRKIVRGKITADPCDTCSGSCSAPDSREERAEFIRVQCELAKLEAVGCPSNALGVADVCNCQLHALRERERKLLAAHGTEWIRGTPLYPSDGTRAVHGIVYRADGEQGWRRGFVEAVECPAAYWLAHADALYWRPGQTAACGRCGLQRVLNPNLSRPRDVSGCKLCDGSGRVPRPCPPTAQPIRKVRLTRGLISADQLTELLERAGQNGFNLYRDSEPGMAEAADVFGWAYPGVEFELAPEPGLPAGDSVMHFRNYTQAFIPPDLT